MNENYASLSYKRSTNNAAITFLHVMLIIPLSGIITDFARHFDYIIAYSGALVILITSICFVEWIRNLTYKSLLVIDQEGVRMTSYGKKTFVPWHRVRAVKLHGNTANTPKGYLLVIEDGPKAATPINLMAWGQSSKDVEDFIAILKILSPVPVEQDNP